MTFLDDFGSDWKSVKHQHPKNSNKNVAHDSDQLIDKLTAFEKSEQKKVHIGMLCGIIGMVVGFGSVLYFTQNLQVIIGISISIFAVIYFIYQSRKLKMDIDSQDKSTKDFLTNAKKTLQTRLKRANHSGWIYVLILCTGMTIVNLEIFDNTDNLSGIAFQFALPFLIGIITMISVIASNKKLQKNKYDPFITEIDELLVELES